MGGWLIFDRRRELLPFKHAPQLPLEGRLEAAVAGDAAGQFGFIVAAPALGQVRLADQGPAQGHEVGFAAAQ